MERAAFEVTADSPERLSEWSPSAGEKTRSVTGGVGGVPTSLERLQSGKQVVIGPCENMPLLKRKNKNKRKGKHGGILTEHLQYFGSVNVREGEFSRNNSDNIKVMGKLFVHAIFCPSVSHCKV